MRTIKTKLSFLWDDETDTIELELTVPGNVSDEEIYATIITTHNWLCVEDPNNTYELSGRTPETLMNYVCARNGWIWEQTVYDLEINCAANLY